MTLLDKLGQIFTDFFGERTELDSLAHDKEASSDYLDPDYFSDLLFYRLYDEEHKIYENKHSFGFVIEVIPLLGGSPEVEKEINSLIREIGDEGASIQCLAWADHRIDRFLNLWSAPRQQKGGIFAEIANKKTAFFQNESSNGEVPPRIFRFLFAYSEPKRGKQGVAMALDKLVEKKKKTIETFNRISQTFEMPPLQLIEFLTGLINFEKDTALNTRRHWNKHTWLSKQMVTPGSAIEVQDSGLTFHHQEEKRLFKSYEVTDYPDQWSIAFIGELLGDFFNKSYRIPSPFYLHYGIHFPSQQKVEMKFRSKAKILDHQIKFPSMVRMFPDMPREREEHLFVHKQLLEGEKFVETRFNCGLWAEPSRHIESESVLIALFQKYGFKLKENHFVHLPDFLSSLPMAWGEESPYIKNLKRTRCFRTTMSSETATLIPLLGEWWGNSTKGMILTSRRGQICSWDPFEAQGNLNTVVIGPSGKGKSVFMQEMILNHLAQGGCAYVLDLGRSFEKLCHLLNGQYLEFSEKSRLDLNPFNFIKSEGDIDTINNGIEMVASIIATMAAPSQQIDKEKINIIHAVVKKAWEQKGKNASVDDILHLLGEVLFKSELMVGATESLKEGLKKFSTTGAYANYFYGKNAVDFSNDLVVIETEELKNMADLQTVILQIFILTISNQIFSGDRSRRCMICIDEAWDLLKSPQMQGFIETLARRLRKYNGSLVTGTQGLPDFEQSYGAQAILNNSNWLVIVGNDNASGKILKDKQIIPIDDFKEHAISSLQKIDGKYSEIFIYNKGNNFFSINQLKLDPFSAMLYSSTAEEFQAIQELQKQGLPIEKALEWLSTHKSSFKQRLNKGQKVREAIASLIALNTTKGEHHVQQ